MLYSLQVPPSFLIMPPRSDKYKQRILLSEVINSYSFPTMPYSNYIQYYYYCVVLNSRSQRYSKCIRYSIRYNALQVSVSNLQNLRLEEERLKFKWDTAFEATIVGLARVRELKRY